MLTIKVKIDSCSDKQLLSQYVTAYTGLFYKIYNNPELMSDPDFISDNLNSFIDKSLYDFCIKDVSTKLSQYETNKTKKVKEISDISEQLSENDFTTRRERRLKYKLFNKLSKLNKSIDKNITFGGKQLLRDITKLSQLDNKTQEQVNLLKRKKSEFTDKRKIGLYLIGRACEKGNRKVTFDMLNDTIVFKPNRNNHITLTYKVGKKQRDILHMLQSMSDNGLIPITVRIDNNYIYMSYDEQLINGYSFNDSACKAEQKSCDNPEDRKQIYIKYKSEQRSRMSKGKIAERYLSFDLNPENIGIVIFDSINNEQVIIHKELIDMSRLCLKLGLPSYDKRQISNNNKRKHEIKEVWKYIFNLAVHYKVFNIVKEDLEFKSNKKEDKPKEFNRKVKNLWHRILTEKLILKYCNIQGLNLIEVNPVYSSFIGNMIHTDVDPIASAIEIGRRGVTKYLKGSSIYPDISLINREKLTYLLGENIDINGVSWKQLYNTISLLRYRNGTPKGVPLLDQNLCSYKSKINRFIYLHMF